MLRIETPSGLPVEHHPDFGGDVLFHVPSVDVATFSGENGAVVVVPIPFEDLRFLVAEADHLHTLISESSTLQFLRAAIRAIRRRMRGRH